MKNKASTSLAEATTQARYKPVLMPRSASISPQIGSFYQRSGVIHFIMEMEHPVNDHQTLLSIKRELAH